MERIQELLSRLSELSEGEMSDLEGTILSEFETVEKQDPTPDVVSSMTALADALDAVRNEQTSRSAQQQELATKAAEQSARVHEAAAEPGDEQEQIPEAEEEGSDDQEELAVKQEDDEEESGSPDEETVPVVPVEEVLPVEETDEEKKKRLEEEMLAAKPVAEGSPADPAEAAAAPPAAPSQPETRIEEHPVAASASDVVVKAPADAQPARLTRPPVTVTAGADIPGRSAGAEFPDLGAVSDAFVKRLHSLRRVTGGDGEQHIVASIHADYPEDRTLYSGASSENWDKINKITSRDALVAAVTCYPLETKYDLFGAGSADRPVRDSLATFTADRAGLRFYRAPTLPAYPNTTANSPTGIWKQDGTVTDTAGTSLTGVKPCYLVTCGDEQTALLEAVSLCLTFDNLTTRANPEIVARHNELALIHHARITELSVLAKIKTGGTAVTGVNYNVGATREFFAQLDGLASAYRYKYRLGARDPLRVIAPEWFRDEIRADLSMQMPGDGLESIGLAQSMIDGWFRLRNINVTWSMDSIATPPSMTTGAFGGTVEWDLFSEGTWLYLDGGTLDIGVIRDSTLVGANDYKTFTEEFVAVAKIGDESLHVTSTVVASGAAAALEDNFS